MKLLLTGIAGFIAARTASMLLEQGHDVVGVDIENALGKKAEYIRKPFHKADIKETSANIEKAERLCGWKPQISPYEGFQASVDWYIENKSWLANVSL